MSTLLRAENLANGLLLEFIDSSNRYFGNFHQVKISLRCSIPLTDELLHQADLDDRDRMKMRELFGDTLEYERVLKRMGVAGEELDRTRDEMIETFLKNSAGYMSAPDFPLRTVLRRYRENLSGRRFRLVGDD